MITGSWHHSCFGSIGGSVGSASTLSAAGSCASIGELRAFASGAS